MSHSVTRSDMQEMVDRGMNDLEIGRELGVSREAAAKLRVRRGVKRDSLGWMRGKKTGGELKRAEALIDEGYSFRSVSELTGMTHETLSRHFPGRAFNRKQVSEAQAMGRALERMG